jgi:hypothetical protein
MTEKMSDYRDRFMGRPAAVLGGGPSLPDDLKRLPPGCLLIAVNYHAQYLVKPDFMVYNDHLESLDQQTRQAILEGDVIRVSSNPDSDIKFDMDVWTGFYSSNTATWFALWMGCDPVILCGMDLYQGERAYFHEYEDQPQFHQPLEHHLQPWIEDAKNMLPGWQRVRAMSGPLIDIFGQYKAEYETVYR